MAYLVYADKVNENAAFVEYIYHGSGWDIGECLGRFQIEKTTGEITVTHHLENDSLEKAAERGIAAVLKSWQKSGEYPAKAEWAS